MARRIVFIHGAWVTPLCWEPMLEYFRAKGYECVAPSWPGKDRPVEAIRADPSPLLGLGIGEIAVHYEGLVRAMDEPPILIGHSFGGLIVQLLLDRGLGAAGVAIDSAPPSGVWPFEPTRSARSGRCSSPGAPGGASCAGQRPGSGTPSSTRWRRPSSRPPTTSTSRRRPVASSSRAPSPASQRAVPAASTSTTRPGAPLFLIAGGADHIVPAVINRRNYRKYAGSGAVTAFREFPGRSHWTIAQDGWQDVADAIAAWIEAPAAS